MIKVKVIILQEVGSFTVVWCCDVVMVIRSRVCY